ncbi:MAG: penicillin acylase family protein [Spirochaetes bacterium]|nr:penicillin acylase family protein [Spirochaetota bacterium]
MPIWKRILIIIALILIGALIAGTVIVRRISTRGLPDYTGQVRLKGLEQTVTVYRDRYGVPHVYARSTKDLYRAVGYCMAQDRLWQMDLLRRVTAGRLSEIFGADLVETDLLMRALRIREKSKRVIAGTDPSMLEPLQAFCDGVNSYIQERGGALPPEFTILGYRPEPWEMEHSVRLICYMAWDLTLPWKSEMAIIRIGEKVDRARLADLVPHIGDFTSLVYPGYAGLSEEMELRNLLLARMEPLERLGCGVFAGSNNWAVSGRRSADGSPMLANDMHLGLFAPGIWYQMHQSVEGGMDVTGVVLPGQPAVVCGHNAHIAWGMTNVMIDDMDFFLEKTNPDNPGEYYYRGGWRKMEVRKERILVSGGAPAEREIRFTAHGPVISGIRKLSGRVVTMKWIGNEESNELRTVFLLNRAKDWRDFTEALRTFRAISQNIVYADRKGNIGLYCAAGIPVRGKGKGIGVMPGWTGEYEWKGFVPFERQPHSYNPPCGYVVSANNRTVGDAYPYFIGHWFELPWRYDRIREMLEAKERLTVRDFMAIQTDQKSKLAVSMKDGIVDALGSDAPLSAAEKRGLAMLAAWDGAMTKQSGAAALFEKFYERFLYNCLHDEIGDELYGEFTGDRVAPNYAVDYLWKMKSSPWFDDIATKDRVEDFTDMTRKSFRDAVSWLVGEMGDDPGGWRWGDIHPFTLSHPLGSVKVLAMLFGLNRGPFMTGGSYHTVRPYSYQFDDPFRVTDGASERHIFTTADWDRSLTVIPTGTSGIPASDHYCDQTKLYVKDGYHQDFVSRGLVKRAARHVMILRPR